MKLSIQCILYVVLIISVLMIFQGHTYFKREQHLHQQTSHQKRLTKQAGLSFPNQNQSSYNIKQLSKKMSQQIAAEQKEFNHQFIQEKKQKIMQFIKTHKPEFDTIQNCQIYNSQESCALCKSQYVLTQDTAQCVKGQIKHCIEYLSQSTCGKCQNGYILSEMLQKCRSTDDYFNDGYDNEIDEDDQSESEEEGSGINWTRPNLVPDSNEIPDGEYDLFEELFNEYLLNSDGEYESESEQEEIIQENQESTDGELTQEELQQQQNQQQNYQNKQISLGGVTDGEAEQSNIELLQEEINKQNKVNAFMSLFDNKY